MLTYITGPRKGATINKIMNNNNNNNMNNITVEQLTAWQYRVSCARSGATIAVVYDGKRGPKVDLSPSHARGIFDALRAEKGGVFSLPKGTPVTKVFTALDKWAWADTPEPEPEPEPEVEVERAPNADGYVPSLRREYRPTPQPAHVLPWSA